MAKSNTMLYKCMLRQVPVGEGDSPSKVQDVIELVTDMGLLIKHSDGCFTINPAAAGSTQLVRKPSSVKSQPAPAPAPETDVKKDRVRARRKVKKAKRSIRPVPVASRTRPSQYRRYRRPRRAHRRAARRSRSTIRGGAKKRQRKPLHKKIKKLRSSVQKKKTLRKFYSVVRRLTDSLTDMSKRIKKII